MELVDIIAKIETSIAVVVLLVIVNLFIKGSIVSKPMIDKINEVYKIEIDRLMAEISRLNERIDKKYGG